MNSINCDVERCTGAREEVEESLACAVGLANDDDDDRVSEDGNHTTIIWLGGLFLHR